MSNQLKEKITVKYINNTRVLIMDVLTSKGTIEMRYKIMGAGFACGKWGWKCFNLLWKRFQYWLRERKLDGQRVRLRIRDWILNACPIKKIGNKNIELVSWDRRFVVV